MTLRESLNSFRDERKITNKGSLSVVVQLSGFAATEPETRNLPVNQRRIIQQAPSPARQMNSPFPEPSLSCTRQAAFTVAPPDNLKACRQPKPLTATPPDHSNTFSLSSQTTHETSHHALTAPPPSNLRTFTQSVMP